MEMSGVPSAEGGSVSGYKEAIFRFFNTKIKYSVTPFGIFTVFLCTKATKPLT